MTNPFIDYSQHAKYLDCELKWFESYRMQYQKEPRPGQRNDARTLGSLTHDGLEHFRLYQTIDIPSKSIEKYNPSPECLMEARQLLTGYIRTYPNEQFTKYYCEEPIKFPLINRMDGLAKIDSYFNIGEPITVESGLGDTFTLEPGFWIHEYKTKAASKDVGKYVGSWRMNMQPAYQMMALAQLVGEMPKGVLVNVLEKAPAYTPIRSCKACKARVELRDWQPTGDGYKCPECDNIQDIDTSDKSKTIRNPKFYRIMVQRSIAELERARIDMVTVAERMLQMDANYAMCGEPGAIRQTNKCVDQIWGNCEFFEPHSQNLNASQYAGFVPIESLAYVGTSQ